MPHVAVPRARLYYEEHGKGEPVLVPDGCPKAWDSVKDIVPILAENYRVVYYEGSGSERSQAENPVYDQLVEEIGWVMDALDIPRAHVLSSCFSANCALDFACRHPERLASLFVADPILFAPGDRPGAGEPFPYPCLPRHPGEWAYVAPFDVGFPDGKDWLRTLTVPTLLFYSSQDPLYRLPGFLGEVSVNPALPILHWPGVRHMGLFEPEEYAGVILEFLADPTRPVHRVWRNLRPSSLPAGVQAWC